MGTHGWILIIQTLVRVLRRKFVFEFVFRKSFLKNCFLASRSPEGAPQRAASPIDCIFTMPRATARLTAFLQGGRAQGAIIPCKNAVDLFCGRPRARRSQDGTFSPPWRLLGCPKRPQEKVWKFQGGHQDGRKLDSLHFYRVPWPPRVRAKRAPQKGFKLRSFFEKLFRSFEVARGCPAEGREPD